MALKLITDSACDLPKNLAEEYGIEIIPTPLIIDGKDYFDGDWPPRSSITAGT